MEWRALEIKGVVNEASANAAHAQLWVKALGKTRCAPQRARKVYQESTLDGARNADSSQPEVERFIAETLKIKRIPRDKLSMGTVETETRAIASTISDEVRERIQSSNDRFWCVTDFHDLPATAVAQAFSRLSRIGVIQRLKKGMYFEARLTMPGPVQPNAARIRVLAERQKRVFPAGMAAAHLLGFTNRIPTRIEIATNAPSLPRLFPHRRVTVHLRRPAGWRLLTETDAALLDVLRNRGLYS